MENEYNRTMKYNVEHIENHLFVKSQVKAYAKLNEENKKCYSLSQSDELSN